MSKESSNILWHLVFLAFGAWAFRSSDFGAPSSLFPKQKLSDYGFFIEKMADLKPSERVLPYSVAAPLFTDHAEKARFIALPPGEKMVFSADSVFQFPVGTALIKTFSFPKTDGSQGLRHLETRLLLREPSGWKALAYVWNEAQDDAVLEVAGAELAIETIDDKGKKTSRPYFVPNLNQCKSCHAEWGAFQPLGPTARQLDHSAQNAENQLVAWKNAGYLEGFERSKPSLAMPDFNDEKQPIERRARAWLDANCGHCHRPGGPANTSGLMLHWAEKDPAKLGIGKAPIAAGRGSGGLDFDIVPGRPEKSILIYRIESLDPGVMMPELGRTLRDEKGIGLLKDWIRAMPQH